MSAQVTLPCHPSINSGYLADVHIAWGVAIGRLELVGWFYEIFVFALKKLVANHLHCMVQGRSSFVITNISWILRSDFLL